MKKNKKARMIGINHIALEVGNIEDALTFYGAIFDFTLRGRSEGMAFIDMGDQFIALMESSTAHQDKHRHFGLVVDDRSRVRSLAESAGAKFIAGDFMDFIDPWGNHVQIVEYGDIQFSKLPEVLEAMKLDLKKSKRVQKELEAKGIKTK
jgi:predicted enzyme related to lactoylglutathione lyase